MQLLVLQCMPFTLDEITAHEERLRSEIMERECLLAALNVLHGYAADGKDSKTIELGLLGSALLSPGAAASLFSAPAVFAPAMPASLPATPPPKPYIHPELETLKPGFGINGALVRWAIQNMKKDYTLRDIEELLAREGRPLGAPKISVVLTRMKARGEIEEIKSGNGRTPAVFRAPASATPRDAETTNPLTADETPSVADGTNQVTLISTAATDA